MIIFNYLFCTKNTIKPFSQCGCVCNEEWQKHFWQKWSQFHTYTVTIQQVSPFLHSQVYNYLKHINFLFIPIPLINKSEKHG